MRFRLNTIAVVLFCLQLSVSAQNSTSVKRSITEKDLFDFVWVTDPQVSSDSSRVVFTRVVVDDKRTGYETSIWITSTSGGDSPIRLTNGKHDSSPRWSPDGRTIAFVRAGEKHDEGKPRPPQIALLSLAGGEARIITDLPKGAASPKWSPDGKRLVFLTSTTSQDIEKQEHKKSSAKPDSNKSETTPEEHESDVHLITRVIYRDNDEGYLDSTRLDQLWPTEIPTPPADLAKHVPLTSGDVDEGQPVWSTEASRIYFLTRRIDEPYDESPTTHIYSIPPAGGNPEK